MRKPYFLQYKTHFSRQAFRSIGSRRNHNRAAPGVPNHQNCLIHSQVWKRNLPKRTATKCALRLESRRRGFREAPTHHHLRLQRNASCEEPHRPPLTACLFCLFFVRGARASRAQKAKPLSQKTLPHKPCHKNPCPEPLSARFQS